jgi:hypothetical protein
MIAAPHSEILFDDILDFLTTSPGPQEILAFQPSPRLQNRLSALLQQQKQQGLSQEDQAELDEFLRMNRFMSRLKLKARQKLKAIV